MIYIDRKEQLDLLVNYPGIRDYIETLLKQEESFTHYSFDELFGGGFFVCENEKDLHEITGINAEYEDVHGKWPSVVDAVCQFDMVDIKEDYAVFFLASNNSGGPTYFVPPALYDLARVREHKKATDACWAVAKDVLFNFNLGEEK